jgi:hypothetical protein
MIKASECYDGAVISLTRCTVNNPNLASSLNVLCCERRVQSQKTLASFTDSPKIQTLTPLKSRKTEVFETPCE